MLRGGTEKLCGYGDLISRSRARGRDQPDEPEEDIALMLDRKEARPDSRMAQWSTRPVAAA
jgi:hypothetical protein